MELRWLEFYLISAIFWASSNAEESTKRDYSSSDESSPSQLMVPTLVPDYWDDDNMECNAWVEDSGCEEGFCCVKKVVMYKDVDKEPLVGTSCAPLLSYGDLCLMDAEGYLCDCGPGLKCAGREGESYGHCAHDLQDEQPLEKK